VRRLTILCRWQHPSLSPKPSLLAVLAVLLAGVAPELAAGSGMSRGVL